MAKRRGSRFLSNKPQEVYKRIGGLVGGDFHPVLTNRSERLFGSKHKNNNTFYGTIASKVAQNCSNKTTTKKNKKPVITPTFSKGPGPSPKKMFKQFFVLQAIFTSTPPPPPPPPWTHRVRPLSPSVECFA